jgi:lycopene cyclase domain-containing protein
MIIVGIPYLIWDVIATARGDWSFNPKYCMNFNFLGLPLEEYFFFITVPYSILFLYETFLFYFPKRKLKINYNLFIIVSLVSFLTAWYFRQKYYTSTIFIFLGIIFFLLVITKPSFLDHKYFLFFILFTFIPFIIENYFLTSIPIVSYNQKAIIGIRITTIPLEDFFYSFSLISLYIYFYELAREKWRRKT